MKPRVAWSLVSLHSANWRRARAEIEARTRGMHWRARSRAIRLLSWWHAGCVVDGRVFRTKRGG